MNSLTSQQLLAAHSPAARTLCSAAAGAGKTRVLVERARWLVRDRNVSPQDICIVTFSVAAAKELIARTDGLNFFHCSTLHSLLLRLLRRHGELIGLPAELTVMSEEESDQQLAGIAAGLKVKASMKVLKEQARIVCGDGVGMGFGKERIVAVEFFRNMKQSGELSYDALLELGHRLIVAHPEVVPFKHLLIDEFQDSAPADERIYEAMPVETRFFVADERQAIYGFRGSDVRCCQRLAADPKTTKMPISTNFRSSQAVIRAANRLFPHQDPRPGAPQGAVTLRQYPTAAAEVDAVARQIAALPQDSIVAVLLRYNRQVDLFRAALQPFGIKLEARPDKPGDDERLAVALLRAMCAPHNDRVVLKFLELTMGSPFARDMKSAATEVLTSVATQVHLKNVEDSTIYNEGDVALAVTMFCSHTGIQCMAATRRLSALATQLPLPCTLGDLLLAAQAREPEPPKGRIHLGTVHSAKGLEFGVVFLPCLEDESWPGAKTGDAAEEEKRLAYVAVTRAKLECHMSWCRERAGDYAAWKISPRTPSRFAVLAVGGVK